MKNRWTWVIFTILITLLIFGVIQSDVGVLSKFLFAIYVPGFFIVINILGGPHGAPSWGFEVGLLLGIFLQNFVIVKIVHFISIKIGKADHDSS